MARSDSLCAWSLKTRFYCLLSFRFGWFVFIFFFHFHIVFCLAFRKFCVSSLMRMCHMQVYMHRNECTLQGNIIISQQAIKLNDSIHKRKNEWEKESLAEDWRYVIICRLLMKFKKTSVPCVHWTPTQYQHQRFDFWQLKIKLYPK